jgi:glycosyltransferase A (GT-A) superfamily protein (DUF2064 family)
VTGRRAAVLVRPGWGAGAAPPGVEAERFRLALAEDTYDLVAGLELVDPVLALCPPDQPGAEDLVWPGTPVVRVAEGSHATTEVLAGLAGLGADQGAVIAADAPDLPPLLVAKLFRALGSAPVAVCPAENGGLVALAARVPAPAWVGDVDLDNPHEVQRLVAAAPARNAVRLGPGWRRLRAPADIAALDPGLEGWDATRALLSRGRRDRL